MPAKPEATVRIPLAVWISLGGLFLGALVQFGYMAKSFGTFETTLNQYGKDIESFRNSSTQTKISEMSERLARVEEQAGANKEELRRVGWQLNRLSGIGSNWDGQTRGIAPRDLNKPNP